MPPASSCVILICLYHSLGNSLLSETMRYSSLILYFLVLSVSLCHNEPFCKESWSLKKRIVFINEDRGPTCAHCYWCSCFQAYIGNRYICTTSKPNHRTTSYILLFLLCIFVSLCYPFMATPTILSLTFILQFFYATIKTFPLCQKYLLSGSSLKYSTEQCKLINDKLILYFSDYKTHFPRGEDGREIGGSRVHFPSMPVKHLAHLRSRANSQRYSSIYEDRRQKIEGIERSDGETIKPGVWKSSELDRLTPINISSRTGNKGN